MIKHLFLIAALLLGVTTSCSQSSKATVAEEAVENQVIEAEPADPEPQQDDAIYEDELVADDVQIPTNAPAAPAPGSKDVELVPIGVVNIENNDLGTYMSQNHLVIIDFNATWCGPCRQLKPVFDKAAETYAGEVTFLSVDVDQNPELAQQYKVRSIPMVCFVIPGEGTKTYVGTGDLLPEQKFLSLVEKYKK